MMAALTLRELGEERDIYLYDTFEGMSEPSAADGATAARRWRSSEKDDHNEWSYASLEEVEQNMLGTVSRERLHLVKGPVEETIPAQAPETIALRGSTRTGTNPRSTSSSTSVPASSTAES